MAATLRLPQDQCEHLAHLAGEPRSDCVWCAARRERGGTGIDELDRRLLEELGEIPRQASE